MAASFALGCRAAGLAAGHIRSGALLESFYMDTQAIQAIIFDFGGVLLDWNPRFLYRRFFDEPDEIDRFLSEIGFQDWNAQQDKGRPFAEGVAELSRAFPKYETLIRAYRDYWEESISGPIGGSVTILESLKREGLELYGLSNWSAETFPIALKKYGFFALFDSIIISGAVNMIKPDPAIFEYTVHRIARPPEQCLIIDDSETNIQVARGLGFAAIHFRSPQQLEKELRDLGILKTVTLESRKR